MKWIQQRGKKLRFWCDWLVGKCSNKSEKGKRLGSFSLFLCLIIIAVGRISEQLESNHQPSAWNSLQNQSSNYNLFSFFLLLFVFVLLCELNWTEHHDFYCHQGVGCWYYQLREYTLVFVLWVQDTRSKLCKQQHLQCKIVWLFGFKKTCCFEHININTRTCLFV